MKADRGFYGPTWEQLIQEYLSPGPYFQPGSTKILQFTQKIVRAAQERQKLQYFTNELAIIWFI